MKNHVPHAVRTTLRLAAQEAFVYHLLLVCHQLTLFWYADRSMYGLIGTLFGLLYSAVSLTNAGLDGTIAPFIIHIRESKLALRTLLMPHVRFTLAVTLAAALLFPYALHYLGITISPIVAVILPLLLISESLKRSLRTLLYLAAPSRLLAVLELANLTIYLILVWSWYALTGTFTPTSVLAPLLAVCMPTVLILMYLTYRWYAQLPDCSPLDAALPARMRHVRLSSALISLAHLLVSANALVPLCAARAGLAAAASVKVVSAVLYSLVLIAQKLSTLAIELARIYHVRLVAQRRWYLLYGIILTGIALLAATATPWCTYALLLALLYSLEVAITAYESWYRVHEYTRTLSALTLLGLALSLSTIFLPRAATVTLMLVITLGARTLHVTLLAICSYVSTARLSLWRLRTKLSW